MLPILRTSLHITAVLSLVLILIVLSCIKGCTGFLQQREIQTLVHGRELWVVTKITLHLMLAGLNEKQNLEAESTREGATLRPPSWTQLPSLETVFGGHH